MQTSDRPDHNGQDFDAVNYGDPVYASKPGTVTFTRDNAVPGDGNTNGIRIKNDDGSEYYYAHVDPAVDEGDQVEQGQVIGHVDNSGRSTGPNVHLEARDKDGNRYPPSRDMDDPVTYQKPSDKPTDNGCSGK